MIVFLFVLLLHWLSSSISYLKLYIIIFTFSSPSFSCFLFLAPNNFHLYLFLMTQNMFPFIFINFFIIFFTFSFLESFLAVSLPLTLFFLFYFCFVPFINHSINCSHCFKDISVIKCNETCALRCINKYPYTCIIALIQHWFTFFFFC